MLRILEFEDEPFGIQNPLMTDMGRGRRRRVQGNWWLSTPEKSLRPIRHQTVSLKHQELYLYIVDELALYQQDDSRFDHFATSISTDFPQC